MRRLEPSKHGSGLGIPAVRPFFGLERKKFLSAVDNPQRKTHNKFKFELKN
jgi:hypothetical protein